MPETFTADSYGPAISKLFQEYRLFELGPGSPAENMRNVIQALNPGVIFHGKTIQNEYMANACLSGIWYYFDFLSESHAISQSIPSTTGSLWHGIMHRRERDYSNAKYWFQKVSTHPIFDLLQKAAVQMAQKEKEIPEQFSSADSTWNPFTFTDLCQEHCGKNTSLENLCRRIQRREWELLFDYSYWRATGE